MKTHQITWHDMTWHLATDHIHSPRVISQPTTKFRISPGNQPHQNRSPHHNHGTAEDSFTQKTRFGHRSGWSPCAHSIGKFFLWLIVFFFETSAPGLPGSTSKYQHISTYMFSDYSGKPKHLPHSCSELFATPKFIPRIKKQNKTEKAKKKMAVTMSAIIQISIETFLAYLALRVSVGSWHRRDLSPRGPVAKLRKLPRLIDVEWGRPKCRC